MTKLAVIGAGDFQIPLLKKCRSLGIETHAFSWEAGATGKDFADYFHPISIREIEKVFSKCQAIGVDGVVSIGSELAMMTVAHVAELLGLASNSQRSALLTQNKFKMKQAFKAHGVPCAQGAVLLESNQLLSPLLNGLDYRTGIIVKPADRSGSLGVKKIHSFETLKEAVQIAFDESFARQVVIEEFMEGVEYSAESISFGGKHRVVAFTRKFTTGSPHFVETGHFQPAEFSLEQRLALEDVCVKALEALEITNGISHIEFMMQPDGKCKIIEVGGRMGGDFIGSHLVQMSTGIDFVRVAIELSLGIFSWQSIPIDIISRPAGVVFLSSNNHAKVRQVSGCPLESSVIAEQAATVKDGDPVLPTTSSCKRFGYIIYWGAVVDQSRAMTHFGFELSH